MHVENSFDLDGYFIGKLPVPLDAPLTRRPAAEPTAMAPVRPAAPAPLFPPRRPPSESFLRSMAATTTANTFVLRNRPMPTGDLSTTVTRTMPSVAPAASNFPPSRFGDFLGQPARPTERVAPPSLFDRPVPPVTAPSGFSFSRTNLVEHRPAVAPPPTVVVKAPTPVAVQPVRPAAPVVQRRLSARSFDVFLDEIYESLLQSVIRETTDQIYE